MPLGPHRGAPRARDRVRPGPYRVPPGREPMPARPFTSSPHALRSADSDRPPPPPPGRAARLAARVVLWWLIGLAALHGILPPPAGPGAPGSTGGSARSTLDAQRAGSHAPARDQVAMATAAVFL